MIVSQRAHFVLMIKSIRHGCVRTSVSGSASARAEFLVGAGVLGCDEGRDEDFDEGFDEGSDEDPILARHGPMQRWHMLCRGGIFTAGTDANIDIDTWEGGIVAGGTDSKEGDK